MRTAVESDACSLFHLNAGIYMLPKAQTHTAPVPRRTCICMQSCTHAHKGLFLLHRLHHTFQVISSSGSHFSSKALHLKQTAIIYSLIYSQREQEEEKKTLVRTNWFLFKQLTFDTICCLLLQFITHSLSSILSPI